MTPHPLPVAHHRPRRPRAVHVQPNLIRPPGKQPPVRHRLAPAHVLRPGPPPRQVPRHNVALHPPPHRPHVVANRNEVAPRRGLDPQRPRRAVHRLAVLARIGVHLAVVAVDVQRGPQVIGVVLQTEDPDVDAPNRRVHEGQVGDGVRVAPRRAGGEEVGVVFAVGGEVRAVAAGDEGEDAPGGWDGGFGWGGGVGAGGGASVGGGGCEGEAPAETEGGVGKYYADAEVDEGCEGWVSSGHVAGH